MVNVAASGRWSDRDVIAAEARLRGITVLQQAVNPDAPVAGRPARVFSRTHLTRVWNGDVGLAEAFWLWAVGARLVLGLLIMLPAFVSFGELLLLPCLAALAAWDTFAAVAVFRSARHYQGWAGWRIAAMIVVGFVCLRSMIALIAVLIFRPF